MQITTITVKHNPADKFIAELSDMIGLAIDHKCLVVMDCPRGVLSVQWTGELTLPDVKLTPPKAPTVTELTPVGNHCRRFMVETHGMSIRERGQVLQAPGIPKLHDPHPNDAAIYVTSLEAVACVDGDYLVIVKYSKR